MAEFMAIAARLGAMAAPGYWNAGVGG
jgi:hypothetical protein